MAKLTLQTIGGRIEPAIGGGQFLSALRLWRAAASPSAQVRAGGLTAKPLSLSRPIVAPPLETPAEGVVASAACGLPEPLTMLQADMNLGLGFTCFTILHRIRCRVAWNAQ